MSSSKMNYLLLVLGTLVAFCNGQASPEFCQLPSDEGEGSTFEFHLYYESSIDRCNPFLYKGKGGNMNRFQREVDCMRNCSANSEKFYPRDVTLACHFKRESGQCGNQLTRFYYDPVKAKCKTFQWTGCVGNGNRFMNAEQCNNTCGGIHDHGEEEEDDDSDTPVAIILGVLLGVVVVAILITVIVFIVKSVNKSKKKAAGKKKEERSEIPLRDQGIEIS